MSRQNPGKFGRRAACFAAGLSLSIVGSASAQQAHQVVWAFVDGTGAKAPEPAYSFSSAGNQILIVGAGGSGAYAVHMLGVKAHHFNVQVSPVGSSGHCSVGDQGSGRTQVICYDVTGHPARVPFTVLVQSRTAVFGSAVRGIAYLTDFFPGRDSWTPQTVDQYNSRGGTNSVSRASVGHYTVTFPGFVRRGGVVQVTVHDDAPLYPHCETTGWTNGSEGAKVGVTCFDKDGTAADVAFDLAYAIGVPLGYVPGGKTRGAYAKATAAAQSAAYTPAPPFNFSDVEGGTGKMKVHKTGLGEYTVSLEGALQYDSASAIVTALDPKGGNAYCSLNTPKFPLVVICYGQGGVPADSMFDVALQTYRAPPQ